MRVLALDLGERRIGVALSDSRGVLASPYGVIERTGDPAGDRARIVAMVAETRAGTVVVGLPLTLAGKVGAAASGAKGEAALLAAALEVPVELADERLTTVEAAKRRRGRADERARSTRSKRQAGRVGIDAEAAAILLEAWLASHPQTDGDEA